MIPPIGKPTLATGALTGGHMNQGEVAVLFMVYESDPHTLWNLILEDVLTYKK